jgi:hypothetical protein
MFEDDSFEVIHHWTRKATHILQHLGELQANLVFPPSLPDPNDDEIEEVTTRRFMFLPNVYVLLCLDSNRYTSKQMWDILYPAILQQQELNVCAPII